MRYEPSEALDAAFGYSLGCAIFVVTAVVACCPFITVLLLVAMILGR